MNNNRLNNKKKGLSGLTAAACGLLFSADARIFWSLNRFPSMTRQPHLPQKPVCKPPWQLPTKQLRDIWINGESNALALEYRLSELAANGKTDESNPFCDINGTLTPTNMRDQTGWFWNDVYYSGIKFPNTILTYINGVEGLEEAQVR